MTSALWNSSFNEWKAEAQRCSFLYTLDKNSSTPVRCCCHALFDQNGVACTYGEMLSHSALLVFPPSFKCILPLCLRKTGLSPFMWVFPLITLSPSVSLWGLVETAEKSELLCSAFTPHRCREEGGGGGGGEKHWALIQLKIMRVEGFSSGVADVLNMDDHMQHIHLHLHLHRASLQSTQQPLHAQQTPQHRDD